jgi:hypothetical protein
LQANEAAINNVLRAGSRPSGRTMDTSKTLDHWKRKAFNDAATMFFKLKRWQTRIFLTVVSTKQ